MVATQEEEMKDNGHFLEAFPKSTLSKSAVGGGESPNLMRSLAELEDDLHQRVMRNLYVMDVPRGNDYYPAVMRVLALKTLPDTYASSPVWQHAHQLYWQIEAMKGNPEAVLWHPV